MKVAKTTVAIENGNPRKEAGEDGQRLAYDISVEFSVPRETIDELVGVPDWSDQFYAGDDTRLEHVYPITYGPRVEDLKIKLYIGLKPMVFDGARIGKGAKLTPLVGQYFQVSCKLQVYPTRDQAGRLDEAVKESAELEIEPMTAALLDVA